jgi:hypothetical protein
MVVRSIKLAEGIMADNPGVYIRSHNGKFHVEHRYMPTPDINHPSSFNEEEIVTVAVGTADTREEAERIKQKYEKKLEIKAQKEESQDDDVD